MIEYRGVITVLVATQHFIKCNTSGSIQTRRRKFLGGVGGGGCSDSDARIVVWSGPSDWRELRTTKVNFSARVS